MATKKVHQLLKCHPDEGRIFYSNKENLRPHYLTIDAIAKRRYNLFQGEAIKEAGRKVKEFLASAYFRT